MYILKKPNINFHKTTRNMSAITDNDTGFTEGDIHFARKTFFRDCPNGRCTKRKFLTFIRKSSVQKSPIGSLKCFQNYRQSKKFFSMMFDIYDRNHDGELDFDEYLYALSAITGANRLRTIETLFRFFDIHNQGYITREEFNSRKKLAAKFLGHSTSGIQGNLLCEPAFNAMDVNKDGRISKEEFIQWHLQDHLNFENIKPTRRRTRLFRNLSTLVDSRGHIQTSSLQHTERNTIDTWLETTMNINPNAEISPTDHADQYLLKIFRRARNRLYLSKTKRHDHRSDSGAFTSSSTTFTDIEFDSNKDDFQSIPANDTDSDLLCRSLQAILIETLLELKEHRQQQYISNSHLRNESIEEDQISISTRL